MGKQNKNIFKKIYDGSRPLVVYGLVYSLLILPMPGDGGRVQAQSALGIASGIVDSLATAGNLVIANRNSILQARIRSRLQQGADGLFTDRSEFFPNCRLLPDNFVRPINACQADDGPATRNGAVQAQAFEVQGLLIQEGIRIMTETGRERGTQFGLQCIQTGKEEEFRRLEAIERQIQRLKQTVNQEFDSQLLVNNLQNQFESVEEVAVLIEGAGRDDRLQGPDGVSPTEKDTKNWGRLDKYFPSGSACHTVLAAGDLEPEVGLKNIRNTTNDNRNSTQFTNYRDNRSVLEEDFNKQLDFARSRFDSLGLRSFIDSQDLPRSEEAQFNFNASINALTNVRKRTLAEDEGRIFSEITSTFGVTPPQNKDHRYFEELDDITNSGIDFFQRNYVKQCATNQLPADQTNGQTTGVDLSSLSGLVQGNFLGNTLQDFQDDIDLALSGDSSFEEKIAAVRAVEQRYNNAELRTQADLVLPFIGPVQNAPISVILQSVQQSCTQRFEQPTNNDDNRSETPRELAERSLQAVRDLRSANENFIPETFSAIKNRVLNCAGIRPPSAPGDCSVGSSFSEGAPDFCFTNADTCAVNVGSCAVQAEQVLRQKITERRTRAEQFNQAVLQTLNRQQELLAPLTAQLDILGEALSERFKGEGFDLSAIEGGVSINPGQPSDPGGLGIGLLGGGSFSSPEQFKNYILQLPGKLDQLLAHIENVKNTINDRVEKHQQQIQERYQNLGEFWGKLAQDCRSNVIDKYNKQVRDQNAAALANYNEQLQQYEEAKNKIKNFCRQKATYDHAPGCGEPLETLQEASTDIIQHISKVAQASMVEYRRICNAYGSDDNSLPEVEYDLADECDDLARGEKLNGEDVFTRKFRGLAFRSEGFASATGLSESTISGFFSGSSSSLDLGSAPDSNARRYLQALVDLRSKDDLCKGHTKKKSDSSIESSAERICKGEGSDSPHEDAVSSRTKIETFQDRLDNLDTLLTTVGRLRTSQEEASEAVRRAIKIRDHSTAYRTPGTPYNQEEGISDGFPEESAAATRPTFYTNLYNDLNALKTRLERDRDREIEVCKDIQKDHVDGGGDSSEFKDNEELIALVTGDNKSVLDSLQEAELKQVASSFIGERDNDNYCEAQAGDRYVEELFFRANETLRTPATLDAVGG